VLPRSPPVLHVAAAGRPAALNALIARVHAGDAATAGELSQGLHASTLCADMQMPWGGSDTPLARRPAALARSVARLTTAQVWPFDRATAAGNGFIQTCLYWPPAPAAPAATAPHADLPLVPVLLRPPAARSIARLTAAGAGSGRPCCLHRMRMVAGLIDPGGDPGPAAEADAGK
jgi:hypothetical protein